MFQEPVTETYTTETYTCSSDEHDEETSVSLTRIETVNEYLPDSQNSDSHESCHDSCLDPVTGLVVTTESAGTIPGHESFLDPCTGFLSVVPQIPEHKSFLAPVTCLLSVEGTGPELDCESSPLLPSEHKEQLDPLTTSSGSEDELSTPSPVKERAGILSCGSGDEPTTLSSSKKYPVPFSCDSEEGEPTSSGLGEHCALMQGETKNE